MRITGASGDEFQLVIVRYQHSDVHADRWESNWLVVNGTVSAADERWGFTEPCVTTFELADLAEWLDEVAAEGSQPSSFEFAEPHLKFAYTPWPRPAVQVTFAHESAPPSAAETVRRAGVSVEFPLLPAQAAEIATDIREALAEFPIRGGAA